MKKSLVSLLTGLVLLTAGRALAQDKPVLNTAPPGATPPPAPQPASQPEPVPTPAPAPSTAPVPAPQPGTAKPSGLDLPSNSDARAAGGSSSELSRKLFLYSNFGLGYGSSGGASEFNISIAPALGYRFTEKFAAGPGITYSYSKNSAPSGYTYSNGFDKIVSSNVGVKGFAQYIVYKEFFVHGEIEVTQASVSGFVNGQQEDEFKKTVTSPLAGVGYRQQFSDRAAADIVILYNFDDSLYALYPNPVIRFSFLFNLGR